ncbi:MAG: S26 family signal peptidase [Candidatus Thermoplasmatota archaeon]|nr:S26 family signal peptidase [Candidatus Thermoplasmatota archaeon]
MATVRDMLVLLAIVAVLASSIWIYTGQPFPSAPMVIIESGSMMHNNHSYGRLGTIDPGDIVLVKKVSSREDVAAQAESSSLPDGKTYGNYGDVIIYRPMNSTTKTPIIHRARCWVYVYGSGSSMKYTVEGHPQQQNVTEINIPELRISNYKPLWNGFITAGDHNLELGGGADQVTNICPQPVKPDWIIGKARGEIPWLGAFKLAITGNTGAVPESDWVQFGRAILPSDVCVLAVVFIISIFAAPWVFDLAFVFIARKINEKKK